MQFDELTYTVAEMMGPPQTLTIDRDGKARYESHSNNSMPDTPEIGTYQTTLSTTDLNELVQALDNPPLGDLPDHWGRINAGDNCRRIVLTSGPNSIEKMVGTTEKVDADLARLFDRLDGLVAQVSEHPESTLTLNVSGVVFDESTLDDANILTLDFEMAVGGGADVTIVNPATLAGDPRLSVRGWPAKPPSASRIGDSFGVNVDSVVELRASTENAVNDSLLQMAPGEVRSFRTSVQLRIAGPQTYEVQLAYQNPTENPDEPAVMVGELFSKCFTINVSARHQVNGS